ncbi:fructoselysine 6-kinase [Rhizobium cauense]|uniref:PfkB family carbohydrate kinase n=1 Tax=Rhizobium cauense TaxID=1166683 RepID=UPI001C6DD744|nr:PfkB family carbohydrate kinase [Rhizobium cauense]MBW9115562.1 fructoselysine 6-kinase [Rhizobium cauense]
MTRFRFAAVGDNCIDRFQPPVGQSLVGGNAVNVAVQLARLGHDALYFGAVGDDADGERTKKALEANGVKTSHLQVRAGITAYTDIEQAPSGDRIIAYEDFGACAGYRPNDADFAVLKTMDHVHLGWIDDGGALRRRLVAEGVSLSQDVSVNADQQNLGVEGLTVAFASAGARDMAAEQRLDDLLAAGAGCAVVTCGEEGALARYKMEKAETAIKPVTVIDTTGAGDSFIAGFLVAFIAGRPLAACLENGRDQAAITCTHVGGFPQQPMPL